MFRFKLWCKQFLHSKMSRASNSIITILNVVFLVVSMVCIAFSLWFHVGDNDNNLCNRTLQKPLLYVGLALFVMSLIGFLGSCCKFSSFMWIYLALIMVLIVALMCFTVFTIVVTNRGVGTALSNQGFDNAKLGDYSNWLRNYVLNAKNWDNIKSCLVKMEFCQHVATGKDAEFYKTSLSQTQSGCCMPPSNCEFQFKNATFWLMPPKGPAVDDGDCKTWSNTQTALCYDCKSCKASILYNIKRQWRFLAVINIIILVVVVAVYSIGCCALRNNRAAALKKDKPNP